MQLSFMHTKHLNAVLRSLFLRLDPGESFVVSVPIPRRECGAVLVRGPAADGRMQRPAAFGGEFTKVHSVAERSVSRQSRLRACVGLDSAVVVVEHRRRSQ